MNKTQEAKLNMYHAVLSYCDLNSTIIGNMAALEKSVEDFTNTTNAIVDCVQMQGKIISGHAANKNFLRNSLIQEAASIAARLYSYGKFSGNIMLQNSVNILGSQLERLKDEQLGPACRNISNAGRPYVSLLGPYNIKVADLNDFDKNIAAYIASIPMPRSAIAARRGYRATLRTLFEKGDDQLKSHLDRQLREFKKTDPEFYTAYKASRELVNNRSTPSQIKGVVVNKKTKALIEGATITVLENGASATSGTKGNYMFKPILPDTYTLKIELEGFETEIIKGVTVKQGKIKRVKVFLTAKR